jgi:hypothetical protein
LEIEEIMPKLWNLINPFKSFCLYCCPPDDNKDNKDDKNKDDAKASEAKIKELEQKNKDLETRLAALKSLDAPDDKSLVEKVEADNKAKEKALTDSKKLEAALTFNLTSDKFINEHKSILPKEIGDIFAAAEKEKYDSAIDKANATKAAIIQSFFNLQANVDLTTPAQKTAIEDYLKLTKKGKEEKAAEIFVNIFEPTLEMIKRIKKAEEVSKGKEGYLDGDEMEKAYKEKLIAGSRKHYLGEK